MSELPVHLDILRRLTHTADTLQRTVCNEQRDSLHSLLSLLLPRGQKY